MWGHGPRAYHHVNGGRVFSREHLCAEARLPDDEPGGFASSLRTVTPGYLSVSLEASAWRPSQTPDRLLCVRGAGRQVPIANGGSPKSPYPTQMLDCSMRAR